MGKNPNTVLDTNVIVSAILFAGKPADILTLALTGQITSVTSSILLAELNETLIKKFKFTTDRIRQIEKDLKESFLIVYPEKQLSIIRDPDDNRVLEASIAGNCGYIVTGDKDLLTLKKYKNISILTPDDFLLEIED